MLPGRLTNAFVVIALTLFGLCPAGAADQNCMATYYRSKSPACVDEVIAQIEKMPALPKGDPNTIIGFLAQIFMTSPEARERLLKAEPSHILKSMEVLSLYRAGLLDDARKIAGNSAASAELDAMHIPLLRDVTPSSYPGDNDLLIGAYMASGDTALIARILSNFSSADNEMASDALRFGFMTSKFGPNLTPKGREPVMAQAACAKYQCKTDPAKMYRIMTLSTAIWALQSLSTTDDGIRKALADFFGSDARLKGLFDAERVAFGNYLAAIAGVAVLQVGVRGEEQERAFAAMTKAASAYENLEPPKDVFAPMAPYKTK